MSETRVRRVPGLGQDACLRPKISLGVGVGGPREFVQATVDTGSDYVVVPDSIAARLNIDLNRGTVVPVKVADGRSFPLRTAEVELTVVSAVDHFVRWRTVVAFGPVVDALFGFAGGLEYFHAGIDYALGRFSLIPRSNLPLTACTYPAPTAAALRNM